MVFFNDYYFDNSIELPNIYANVRFGDYSGNKANIDKHFDRWYSKNFHYRYGNTTEDMVSRNRNVTGEIYRRYHNATEWNYNVRRAFYNSVYNAYYNRNAAGRAESGRDHRRPFITVYGFNRGASTLYKPWNHKPDIDQRLREMYDYEHKVKSPVDGHYTKDDYLNSKDYDFMKFYRNVISREMLTPEDYFFTEYLPRLNLDSTQIFARGEKMVLTDLTPKQKADLLRLYRYSQSYNEIMKQPKNTGIAGYLEVNDLTPKDKDVPVFKAVRPVDRQTGKSYISPMNSRHTLKLFQKHPEIRERLQKMFNGGM